MVCVSREPWLSSGISYSPLSPEDIPLIIPQNEPAMNGMITAFPSLTHLHLLLWCPGQSVSSRSVDILAPRLSRDLGMRGGVCTHAHTHILYLSDISIYPGHSFGKFSLFYYNGHSSALILHLF